MALSKLHLTCRSAIKFHNRLQISNFTAPLSLSCRFTNPSKDLVPVQLVRPLSSLKTESNDDFTKRVVYVGPLSKQIRNVKIFSVASSIIGISLQPLIFLRATELNTSLGVLISVCTVVGFFTFITPLLLHFITKKYVTSIEYNPVSNLYTASTYSLFVRPVNTEFRAGEAILPDVPGAFTSVTVRGKPLFIDYRFFNDVDDYKKIMGYDKPMDFKLGKPEP